MNIERYQNVGSVIAIVVIVFGALIAASVVPFNAVTVGLCIVGAGAARLT